MPSPFRNGNSTESVADYRVCCGTSIPGDGEGSWSQTAFLPAVPRYIETDAKSFALLKAIADAAARKGGSVQLDSLGKTREDPQELRKALKPLVDNQILTIENVPTKPAVRFRVEALRAWLRPNLITTVSRDRSGEIPKTGVWKRDVVSLLQPWPTGADATWEEHDTIAPRILPPMQFPIA